MQFREFAENLLGSRVKVKLIRFLLSEEAITSEREIAQLIGISHAAVNRALKDLHELNLINPMRVGNVTVWQLNKQSYAYGFLTNFFYKVKTSPLEQLKTDIKAHLGYRQKVKKAVIYGSVAEGRELPNSDIDLFILVEDEKERKDVMSFLPSLSNNCLQSYGNKLSPNIFTCEDYSNPKNKKFLESVSRGITVFEK